MVIVPNPGYVPAILRAHMDLTFRLSTIATKSITTTVAITELTTAVKIPTAPGLFRPALKIRKNNYQSQNQHCILVKYWTLRL